MQQMQWRVLAAAFALAGGLVTNANALDRLCAAYYGGAPDDYISVDGKLIPPIGLATRGLYDPQLSAETNPWPAAAWNRIEPVVPPAECPSFHEVAEVQAGPILFSHAIYDSETVFYALRRDLGRRKGPDGSCGSVTERWSFDDPTKNGTALVCTRAIGPIVTIPSRNVRVGRMIEFKIQAMRASGSGPAVVGLPMEIRLRSTGLPGAMGCAKATDSNGAITCNYLAPRQPTVETVEATSVYTQPATGTITVIQPPIVVGFFNGVFNTREQAGDGLKALKDVVGPTHRDIPLRYESFYNQTGEANGNSRWQDIAETFIQRGNEMDGVLSNRWETFWDLVRGRQADPESSTGGLLSRLGQGGRSLADLVDTAFSQMLTGFAKGLSGLLSSPPNTADAAAHVAKLQGLADDGSDFVLVAHSQGNLFMNLAYDSLRASRPEAKAKTVHVAPASPTLRGKHVLADIDLVIGGLGNFGPETVQPINLWLPRSRKDASGHTFVGTYLDGERQATYRNGQNPCNSAPTSRDCVKTMTVTALDAL